MLLSCPAKKVTKESGIGEALRLVAPAPEPPSPMYPTRRALTTALEHLNWHNLFSGYSFTVSGLFHFGSLFRYVPRLPFKQKIGTFFA